MLWLLPEVFDEQLVTTEAVAEEVETSRALGYEAPELAALSWLTIRPATMPKILKLVPDLGPGEAAVLAIGLQEPTLLLDDGLARSLARLHNLKFTGTLGVLLRGKREGLVAEIRPLLLDLRRVDFHLSTPLLERTLRAAGEL